jgi:sec-independent protein translocase protein TatA
MKMTGYAHNILAWTPGTTEWIIILVVALLLFGKRLPELARGLGRSLTEFKKGLNEVQNTKDDVVDDIAKTKDDIVNEAKNASGLKDIDKH